MSATLAPALRPAGSTGPLSAELVEVTGRWSESQHRIVGLAATFADSTEWVRIGRQLRDLPATADAFDAGRLS